MPKRVLISAAASGIGLAIARAFAGEGDQVSICDIDRKALADVARNHPSMAATHVDVTDEAAVDRWFDDATEKMSGLDVLINNAGIKGPTGYVEDLKYQDWRQCLVACLDSHFLLARRAAPILKTQRAGSIINLSSSAGLFGYGLRTPYAAAKWGVIGFTKSLAVELGPFGVTVNAICPGSVEGDRMDRVIAAEAAQRNVAPEQVRAEYTAGQSIKRFVKASEIADMCLFLASPAAKMVSGQAISVDGHTETFHIGA
ncbi:SDR family oxidoreductase [soil metagenome]